jgi:hypothetical protein
MSVWLFGYLMDARRMLRWEPPLLLRATTAFSFALPASAPVRRALVRLRWQRRALRVPVAKNCERSTEGTAISSTSQLTSFQAWRFVCISEVADRVSFSVQLELMFDLLSMESGHPIAIDFHCGLLWSPIYIVTKIGMIEFYTFLRFASFGFQTDQSTARYTFARSHFFSVCCMWSLPFQCLWKRDGCLWDLHCPESTFS